MLASNIILASSKWDASADLTQCLTQAGFLLQEGSGFYSYQSLGLLGLRQIEDRARKQLDALGLAEWSMASLQQNSVWEKTGRAADYGQELMSVQLRSGQIMRLSATAEEQVTQAVLNQLQGRYHDFHVYQITQKWRDELRARGGLLRGREFRMLDAYHFAQNEALMHAQNQKVLEALVELLESFGCVVRVENADCGEIGGLASQEIQVKTDLVEEGWLEVGHCFALGQTYSQAFGLKHSEKDYSWMSCQGLGTSRLLAVLLHARRSGQRIWGDEQFSIFDDVLVCIAQSQEIREQARRWYHHRLSQGRRVLWEDRFERAGQALTASEAVGAQTRWLFTDRLDGAHVEKETLGDQRKEIQKIEGG